MVTTLLALSAMARLGPVSRITAADLQSAIHKAYLAGKKEYILAPGLYRLPKAAGDYFLNFSDMKNFAIRGTGATLLLEDATRGAFHFTSCKQVTLAGFTVVHDPVPFSQATVTNVDLENGSLSVDVMPGYPDWASDPNLITQSTVGDIFDKKTKQWKAGTFDIYLNGVNSLGGKKFRLNVANPSPQPVAVGDFMIFRGLVNSDLQLDQCARMDVRNLTFESSAGFCVHEENGGGGNHYTFRLTYGPVPKGASARPLISSNADAFHSNATRTGPIVEDCLFEGMPDDGANIHGNYAAVVAVKGDELIVNTLWGDLPVIPGDPLIFYSSTDAPLGLTANVKSAEPLPGYVAANPSSLPYFSVVQQYWKIDLDRSLKLNQDNLVAMPRAEGDGFVFRNNVILNNRSRGIVAKASNGLVEGNLIEGSTMGGIVISPELAGGMESDFCSDLVVRNNVIRHIAYQNVGSWVNQVGAISVTADPGAGIGHHHILIEGNLLESIDGTNLLISNAEGATVRENWFLRPMHELSDLGSTYGFDPSALINLQNDRSVFFEGNHVLDPGPAMKARLFKGTNVSGVRG